MRLGCRGVVGSDRLREKRFPWPAAFALGSGLVTPEAEPRATRRSVPTPLLVPLTPLLPLEDTAHTDVPVIILDVDARIWVVGCEAGLSQGGRDRRGRVRLACSQRRP